MRKCTVYYYLAFIMCMYVFASVFYLVRTRYIGTPFKDSLTDEQLKIKKESAGVRKNIFVQGVVVSIPVTYLLLKYST